MNHVIKSFQHAQVTKTPFQHLYIQNVWPWDFYEALVRNLPADEEFTDKSYEDRMMCDVRNPMLSWMLGPEFQATIMEKFEMVGSYRPYIRFVRDTANYQIKPHTDIKKKAITLLFYLPSDHSAADYGTSIYVPKQEGFVSDGTRRFEFENFTKVWTAPFVPNSVLGFKRAENSFHGVERKGSGVRNVLLYNLLA